MIVYVCVVSFPDPILEKLGSRSGDRSRWGARESLGMRLCVYLNLSSPFSIYLPEDFPGKFPGKISREWQPMWLLEGIFEALY